MRKMSYKILLCVLMFGFLQATKILGATYYVAGSYGNDSRTKVDATSVYTPWKTIQKAANEMVAGDVCIIRTGIYRETVTINCNNVTFEALNNEIVVISGAEPITGWTPDGTMNSVYQAIMPSGWNSLSANNQVFLGSGTQDSLKMMPEARWPNANLNKYPWEDSDVEHDNDDVTSWSYVDSAQDGTTYRSFTDAQLTGCPTTDLIGATIHILPGHAWYMQHRQVMGFSGSTITTNQTIGQEAAYAIQSKNEYYLTGKKAFMDSNGEWFYDTNTEKICIYSSSGVPSAGAGYTEVKSRSYGFDLNGMDYVTLKNFSFFACTIKTAAGTAPNEDASTDCVFNGLKMKYLRHDVTPAWASDNGLILRDRSVLRNSELAYDSVGLVTLNGEDIRVYNNYLHDSGYNNCWRWMLAAYNAHTRITPTKRALVSHNTLHGSARALMGFTGPDSIVEYNDMYDAMRMTSDGGIYYAINRTGDTIEMHHNLLHDSEGPQGHVLDKYIKGFYLDNINSGWIFHHNMIWNVPETTLHLGNRQNFNLIFNNTCWGAKYALTTSGDSMKSDGPSGSAIFNNIFNTCPPGSYAYWGETGMRCNLYGDPDPFFVEGEPEYAADFQLSTGSPAIDRGMLIPGITDGYNGNAPDLGALESGGTDWTQSVGYNPANNNVERSYVAYNYDFTNKALDPGFEDNDISTAGPWRTTGSNLSVIYFDGNSFDDLGVCRNGKHVLQFTSNTGTSEIRQTVTGLLPYRKYYFYCGAIKNDANAVVEIGVRNYDGSKPAQTVEALESVTGSWYLSFGTWDTLMYSVPFVTGSAGSAEIYVSVTGNTENVYVDDPAVMLSLVPQQLFEAETAFDHATEVVEAGSRTVVIWSRTGASGGQALALPDVGDLIQKTFTAPQTGDFILSQRVRCGNSGSDQYYFTDGYSIMIDGQTVSFIPEAASVTVDPDDATIYWGTMISPTLSLAAGSHTISVTALKSWGLMDCLDVVPQKIFEAETGFVYATSVVADPGSNSVAVATGFTNTSQGQGVRIYDAGDAFQMNFTVPQNGCYPQTGYYQLNLRVRSGQTGDMFNGYAIQVDGQNVSMTGDMTSIKEEDPSSPYYSYNFFWGNIASAPVVLTPGTHSLTVTATLPGGVVDYLDVIPQEVFEAETAFNHDTEVVESGSYKASIWSRSGASGNQAVSLPDVGDKIQKIFAVPQAGTFFLNLRVRCGNSGSNQYYFNGGYSVMIDGQPVSFTPELASITGDPDDSTIYWGTMASPALFLLVGNHTITVEALKGWGLMDCLNVIPQEVFEAETAFNHDTEVVESGSYTVSIWSRTGASFGQAVSLPDVGDKIQKSFTVPQAGTFFLNLRVRCGNSGSNQYYFNGGYSVMIDGQPVSFTPELASITGDPDDSTIYWGTMASPALFLLAGNHTITVEALKGWGLMDCLVVNPMQAFEAEIAFNHDTEVVESGSYTVSIWSRSGASGNRAVSLPDVGDKIQKSFTVPQAGTFFLNLRVRCGNSGSNQYYFNGGYSVMIDGQPVSFTPDLASITGDPDDSTIYWGTMSSPSLSLSTGNHTITVEALKGWGLMDCLYVIPLE